MDPCCWWRTVEVLRVSGTQGRFAASSASAQLEDDRAATAIWKLEIFWWQAQLEDDRATTAIWNSSFLFGGRPSWKNDRATTAIWEHFGGRPSWKVTGLQLQSGNSRFFGGREGDRATKGFGGRSCWKATWLQLQSRNSRCLVAGPAGKWHGYNCNLGTVAGLVARRQGFCCNLGTRDFFGWQAQLENDRATTAIWELVVFTLVASCQAAGLQWQV